MPYASLAEVYGGGFGQVDPQKLAQNYGMRNIETYKQKGVPDSALPMEVGVTNMDIVKFNSRQQREVEGRGGGQDMIEEVSRGRRRERRGGRREARREMRGYSDEPNFRYSTMRGVDDEDEIDDVEEGYDNVESFVPRGRSLHERFLEHFGKCSGCREKVWDKFSNYVETRKESMVGNGRDIREMFGSGDVPPAAEKAEKPYVADAGAGGGGNGADSYVDVIIMILLGIFIIFVLDAFVKLGRGLGGSASSE